MIILAPTFGIAAIVACYFIAAVIRANEPATQAERLRREAKIGNRWFDRWFAKMVD